MKMDHGKDKYFSMLSYWNRTFSRITSHITTYSGMDRGRVAFATVVGLVSKA